MNHETDPDGGADDSPATSSTAPVPVNGALRFRRTARAAVLPALLLLAACGSGSGDSASTEPVGNTPEPQTPTDQPAVPADDAPVSPPVTTPDDEPAATPPDDPTPIPVTPTDAPTALVPRVDVIGLDGLRPYRPEGRHASVLAECALIENARNGCTLNTLPFIAQETDSPTVDDVMERLLVSHDWMGERFEQLLRNRPAELLPLFGSVTSIAIGSTVRPSNYWTGTGGIQLDPAGLWLTVEEKSNISVQEDFRAPFRSLLDFRNLWTIHVEGESIFGNFGLEDRSERQFSDIERPTMSLLFHELAHANDFLPPNSTSLLDSSLPPAFALGALQEQWLSRSLDIRLPLNSTTLTELAGVRFRGETPTPEQQRISGTVAGAEMADDGATHFYSYSTIREDFANLFEAVQMKRVYNADFHIGYVSQPNDPERFSCADLLVQWGVRNRLGNPTVRNRANDVTQSIYGPDPELDAFLAGLEGTEMPLEVGVDWCTNLSRPAVQATTAFRDRTPAVDAKGMMPMAPGQSHAARHAIIEPTQAVR